MKLKIYQENAIDQLLAKAKKLLSFSGGKKLVFKSADWFRKNNNDGGIFEAVG